MGFKRVNAMQTEGVAIMAQDVECESDDPAPDPTDGVRDSLNKCSEGTAELYTGPRIVS